MYVLLSTSPFVHGVTPALYLVLSPAAHAAGKGVVVSHSLPVVAMGSIPHIYRREDRSPGDPNRSCPSRGNHAVRLITDNQIQHFH